MDDDNFDYCQDCKALGYKYHQGSFNRYNCPTCDGTGRVEFQPRDRLYDDAGRRVR